MLNVAIFLSVIITISVVGLAIVAYKLHKSKR
jgi:hypothetical protein